MARTMIARRRFADQHGHGEDPLLPVDRQLVDVLAEDDGGHTQHVGQAGQDDVPVPAMRQHVVAAADHQRTPDQQDGHLAQGEVLERPGVEENKEGTEANQDQECRCPSR